MRVTIRNTVGIVFLIQVFLLSSHAQHLFQRAGLDSADVGKLIARIYNLRVPDTRSSLLAHGISEHDKCGMRTYADIRRNWDGFNEQQKLLISGLLQRPTSQVSIRSNHFRIHYDTVGVDAPALLDAQGQRIPNTVKTYIDSVASIFDHVWDYEVNVMGYPPPPPDDGLGGGNEFDVYVMDLGSQFYGDTTPEDAIELNRRNPTFTSYIRIDNDYAGFYSVGMNGLRVTAAHEFHHAIQVGNYGFWTSDVYYYELTSTWLEDVLYDEVDDYFQYLPTCFSQTYVPFNQHRGYDLAVWGIFLSKRYGWDIMRSTWESMRDAPSLPATDQVLKDKGSSFKYELAEFWVWNYYTGYRANPVSYYPEGGQYPMIKGGSLTQVDFLPPELNITNSALSLSSQYYQVIINADTTTLVLTNLNLSDAVTNDDHKFPFSYTITTKQEDDSFTHLPNGLNVRLEVTDPFNWKSTPLSGRIVGIVTNNVFAYPNPFRVDGRKRLTLPTGMSMAASVKVYVYSSGLDLVYASTEHPVELLGENVVQWDGRDANGELVRSGIYFYLVSIEGRKYTGKFAVVRE